MLKVMKGRAGGGIGITLLVSSPAAGEKDREGEFYFPFRLMLLI
jgi:hypothetical protein